MKKILVIAPHPDDETLGCGGMLLSEKEHGAEIYWLVVTNISASLQIDEKQKSKRSKEISDVCNAYGFAEFKCLNFPAAALDTVPMHELVGGISKFVAEIEPTDIFVPFPKDAHSDHRVVFEASVSVSKWFRYSSVDRVFSYETQSETDFDISPETQGFRPNTFVNITDTIEKKIEIAKLFESEFKEHPFPRSFEAIMALAKLRGAASGFGYAEAFMLLKQRIY